MGCGEQVICLTLFICLAVAVLSTVSLFYLTAIVYVPVQKELEAGWKPEPVRCTTILNEMVDCATTDWISCYEWCISDPGGACNRVWVSVRENGTDVELQKCSKVFDYTCPTLADPPANETLTCKDIDNYQCANLTELYVCLDGICTNITHVYDCTFNTTDVVYDCRNRKNCVDMTGPVYCQNGICTLLEEPWECDRKCDGLVLSEEDRNVVVLFGDRLVSAFCEVGFDAEGDYVWDNSYTSDRYSLFISCSDLQVNELSGTINASDCINGSALPRHIVPPVTNYTELHKLYQENGYSNKLDPTNGKIPFDVDTNLIPKTRLKINDQGCVNTLREECKAWTAVHSRDGANSTARARFPCFVMRNNTDYVVTRHSVAEIEKYLLFMLTIPLSLWCASCFCIMLFSCCIKIDDMGHFRISSQVKVKEKPQSRPRSAWDEPVKKDKRKQQQQRANFDTEEEEERLMESRM